MQKTSPVGYKPRLIPPKEQPEALRGTLPVALDKTLKTDAVDEPSIPYLPSGPNLMIVRPNIDRLVAEQKKIKTQTVNQRNSTRYLNIEGQLRDIHEPAPKGFYGLFENLPVLRIRFGEHTPNPRIEKWFYLGKVKDEGKLGYGFVRVKDINGQKGLEYKFADIHPDDLTKLIQYGGIDLNLATRYVREPEAKRHAQASIIEREFSKTDEVGYVSPKLTTKLTLDKATEGFNGPDLSRLPYIRYDVTPRGQAQKEYRVFHVLGKVNGKYNLIQKKPNGILEIIRKDALEIDRLTQTKKIEYCPSAKTSSNNKPPQPKIKKEDLLPLPPIKRIRSTNTQSTQTRGFFGWLSNAISKVGTWVSGLFR